jgi:hypothetical protein
VMLYIGMALSLLATIRYVQRGLRQLSSSA